MVHTQEPEQPLVLSSIVIFGVLYMTSQWPRWLTCEHFFKSLKGIPFFEEHLIQSTLYVEQNFQLKIELRFRFPEAYQRFG